MTLFLCFPPLHSMVQASSYEQNTLPVIRDLK